jgi:hypothetical protein
MSTLGPRRCHFYRCRKFNLAWCRVGFASSSCSVQEKGHPTEPSPLPYIRYYFFALDYALAIILARIYVGIFTFSGRTYLYLPWKSPLERESASLGGLAGRQRPPTLKQHNYLEVLGRRPVRRALGPQPRTLISVASTPNPILLALVSTITYERGAFIVWCWFMQLN